MKTAILQVADTGPLESLVVMLRSVGYECRRPNPGLLSELRSIGCDTVLDNDDLVRGMGYEKPMDMPWANTSMMDHVDLYVDIKAHRNGPKVWKRWPNLKYKTLYYRINGCEPEVTKHGDERHLPCPILTPNMWYEETGPWSHHAYAMWPPFYRFDDYKSERKPPFGNDSVCLVHNLEGWGYGALIDSFRGLGVKMYGRSSPDGLLQHGTLRTWLNKCLAYVHMKSSDSPGYALYEALAAGCPLIVPRRLIWRSHMEDLLIPGETCLVYDRCTHDGLSEKDVVSCTDEVRYNLGRLKDANYNRKIGEAGRQRLKEIMWSERDPEDVLSLNTFMTTHF